MSSPDVLQSTLDDQLALTTANQWKTVDMFRDINLEADSQENFKKGSGLAGHGCRMVDHGHVSEDIKARAIKSLIPEWSLFHNPPKRSEMIETINPLATPKGVKRPCEVCTRPGRFMCRQCRVTYYCSKLHVLMDERHQSLCLKTFLIRGRMDLPSFQVYRCRAQGLKNLVSFTLLEETLQNAVVNYFGGRIVRAIAAFKVCFPLIKDTFGFASCEAITCLVFLSASFLTINSDDKATSALNIATITLREKLKQCPKLRLPFTRGLVCQAQGNLNLYQGYYKEAIYYLSEGIYLMTKVYGPRHVRLCSSYLLLAKAFVASDRKGDGISLMGFVVDVWKDYMEELFVASLGEDDVAKRKVILPGQSETSSGLSLYLELENKNQLAVIKEYVACLEENSTYAKLELCLMLVDTLKGNFRLVLKRMEEVYDIVATVDDVKLKKLAKKLKRYALRMIAKR